MLTKAVENFTVAFREGGSPDPDLACAWAEPLLGIERFMRALVSIVALLALIAEPRSLGVGFKAAWTEVINA